MKCTTEKELGEALKNNQDEIKIEGNLAKKTFKIHATGNAAWVVACGAIAVAIVSILASPETGGASFVATAVSGTAAVTILGISTATSAVMIGVAAGSAHALDQLREYKVVEYRKDKLILKRK